MKNEDSLEKYSSENMLKELFYAEPGTTITLTFGNDLPYHPHDRTITMRGINKELNFAHEVIGTLPEYLNLEGALITIKVLLVQLATHYSLKYSEEINELIQIKRKEYHARTE